MPQQDIHAAQFEQAARNYLRFLVNRMVIGSDSEMSGAEMDEVYDEHRRQMVDSAHDGDLSPERMHATWAKIADEEYLIIPDLAGHFNCHVGRFIPAHA